MVKPSQVVTEHQSIPLIPPHGGTLINRVVTGEIETAFRRLAATLPRVTLDAVALADLELIAVGAYSPLRGFMGQADYRRVVHEARLADGTVWPLPIVLRVAAQEARDLKEGQRIALVGGKDTPVPGEVVGLLELQEIVLYAKETEAHQVYRTADPAHPGVARLYTSGPVLLAGPIWLLDGPKTVPFPNYHLTPAETRAAFQARGWRRIVAFQTRSPIHRAHEYLLRSALEVVDGLLLHPLVGQTKADDIPADLRLRTYERLIANDFPRERLVLSLFPAAMRYAGPREALFHGLVRKNYGATHFIVGRDAAGVGDFYGPYDSQRIWDGFSPAELGITPLFFENTFYCYDCAAIVTPRTCPHDQSQHLTLSGTRVRSLLARRQYPPVELVRKEVADLLMSDFVPPVPTIKRASCAD
ncbi:MAG: sulfate adenylyltransferase [Ardenticatenaceae bacterium]|nr:sulfate adenylyltransferase [Ardenticatenaceae bacterium]HBY98163.1 sulfate adenylyltransferase [Chloroflexota bacterium]